MVLTANALHNVTQWQKAHAIVARILARQGVEAADRIHQSGVAVHGPLGFASGARGVNQNRQVLGLTSVAASAQSARLLLAPGATPLDQRLPAHDHGVMELLQASHVKHHDVAQARQLIAHRQGLVELLVVFHKQHHAVRVLAKVLHLGCGVGGVNAVGDGATAQNGQVAQHPLA